MPQEVDWLQLAAELWTFILIAQCIFGISLAALGVWMWRKDSQKKHLL